MKVLVLGGDGFCGWPCAVNLADQGHDVLIVDDLSRRKIDIDLEVESLTPIATIGERLSAWSEISGKPMRFVHMDIAHEYQRLLDLLIEEKPNSIVHFAEQRAAPYSMKSSATKRYTVDNNVNGTHNPPGGDRRIRPGHSRGSSWNDGRLRLWLPSRRHHP